MKTLFNILMLSLCVSIFFAPEAKPIDDVTFEYQGVLDETVTVAWDDQPYVEPCSPVGPYSEGCTGQSSGWFPHATLQIKTCDDSGGDCNTIATDIPRTETTFSFQLPALGHREVMIRVEQKCVLPYRSPTSATCINHAENFPDQPERKEGYEYSAWTKSRNPELSTVDGEPRGWWFFVTAESGETLGPEAIALQNDRDFSDGTVGNWEMSRVASSVLSFSSGDTPGPSPYLFSNDRHLLAVLSTAHWEVKANTPFRIKAEFYVPEANISKLVGFKTKDLEDATPPSYQVAIPGDAWTEVNHQVLLGSDIVGGLALWLDMPTHGDRLYFKNVSIREVLTAEVLGDDIPRQGSLSVYKDYWESAKTYKIQATVSDKTGTDVIKLPYSSDGAVDRYDEGSAQSGDGTSTDADEDGVYTYYYTTGLSKDMAFGPLPESSATVTIDYIREVIAP